ncbi:MAG: M15 family metallopeptidase [Lachnospiraceae bacterium]|nr:M15 family metallopeptidase [Lachnospiraceae bacterium]
MTYKGKYALLFLFFFAMLWKIPVFATETTDTGTTAQTNEIETPEVSKHVFEIDLECNSNQTVTIDINLLTEDEVDGFHIYRADAVDGEYTYIGNVDVTDDYYEYWYDDYYDDAYEAYDNNAFFYNDTTVLEAYKTYYYRVEAYVCDEDNAENKTILQVIEANITIQKAAPVVTYGKRNGTLGIKLKWEQDSSADGYLIYYVKDYTDRSRYQYVDVYDRTKYTLAKSITKNSTVTAKFKKLMNGVTYTYRICSYKMIDGEQVQSAWSEPKSILMDYYSNSSEMYTERIKRAFGSEKKKKKNFKTAAKAAKQMKTIKIKVWDFKNGKNGKKVTRIKYLTVNKRLAPSIKAMFDEIYKAKQKQVIKDIGCYSYRTGEHMYGMAIDINPNENYMIDDGQILSGSFWNPKKSKYSIPLDCEMVRIMERYGFYRGFWGDRKDYMHFSYFGT